MRGTWSMGSSSARARRPRAAVAVLATAAFAALLIAMNLAAWAQGQAIPVVIEHFAFAPATVAVASGNRVTFTNRDIVPHTATAVDGSWTTRELASGESDTVAIDALSGKAFFCRNHRAMTGQLSLAEPAVAP